MKRIGAVALVLALLLCGCGKKDEASAPVPTQAGQTVNEAANALKNPPFSGPKDQYTPVDPGQLITLEQAQQIALERAGVTQEDVTGLHTSLEIEDGRQAYEVEFRVGHWEYSFEIDGITGEVLSFEKED